MSKLAIWSTLQKIIVNKMQIAKLVTSLAIDSSANLNRQLIFIGEVDPIDVCCMSFDPKLVLDASLNAICGKLA